MAAELAANGLMPARETLCDGNCGLRAFGISLLDAGKRYAALSKPSCRGDILARSRDVVATSPWPR
eukprot:1804835-Lingulodinium_polyedra.AAC.1